MSNYQWLNEASLQFLQNGYLLPGQTVDERVDIITNRAEQILGIPGFAAKFKGYFQQGWYSLSTPIWTNFGNQRGSPISCFGSNIADTMESILATQAEVGMLTKIGGGTAGYFGHLRPRGSPIKDNGVSSGAVHFMQLFDKTMNIVSQGSSRRGNFAAYLPIDHGDIDEFLTIRSEGSPIQDISFGVCVPEGWMQSMIDGDVSKRKIWAKVIEARINTGYPYIIFIDNVNSNKPDVYKDNGMEITHSQLCTEIFEYTSNDKTFVCDLGSMNVVHYDKWKSTDAVETMVYFLDAVMSEFIEKAQKIPFAHRAVKFAIEHRALGVGWIGWHTLLQSKMIPFESMEAGYLNVEIAKFIQAKAIKGSQELFEKYGASDLMRPYKRRNSTLLAITPTKSSSFILGQVSEGIKPNRTNYDVKDLQKGKFTLKNKQLEQLLASKNANTPEVWNSILQHGGSVQHLTILSDHEKAVFRHLPKS